MIFVVNLAQPHAPPAQAQDRTADAWNDKTQSLMHTAQQSGLGSDYTLPLKRDSLFLERDSHLDSQIPRPGGLSSLYRPEPPLSGLHSTGLGRSAGVLVTQVCICRLCRSLIDFLDMAMFSVVLGH